MFEPPLESEIILRPILLILEGLLRRLGIVDLALAEHPFLDICEVNGVLIAEGVGGLVWLFRLVKVALEAAREGILPHSVEQAFIGGIQIVLETTRYLVVSPLVHAVFVYHFNLIIKVYRNKQDAQILE